MKKFSPKLYLLAITLGLVTMLFSHAADIQIGVEHQIRNNMGFISDIFWQAGPSDSEIAQSLFGTGTDGITAYTQNRSGYTVENCNPDNMTVNHVLPGNFNDSTNPTIADNTIFVLDSGNYSYLGNPLQYLSGTCIALIASGNVSLDWSIIPINNPGKIIIDNIGNPEVSVSAKAYTNTGNEQIVLSSDVAYTGYYTITGLGITNQITGMIQTNTKTGSVSLTQGEGEKIIDVIFGTGDTLLMHFTKSIIFDTTNPTFIGITQDENTITSGGIYNTGVSFSFYDINLSGATINGNTYISGDVITGEGNYSFIVKDLAGNSTGVIFKIDTTLPIFTGRTLNGVSVISGGLYNTGVEFTFTDANFSEAKVDGITYTTGTPINVEGNHAFVVTDKAGNSTGVNFSIDTTLPVCTPISPLSGSTVTSGALALSWTCSDSSGLSGLMLIINDSGNHIVFTTNFADTGTSSYIYTGGSNIYNWKVGAIDIAGNNSTMGFQRITYIKPIIITLQNPGNLYQGKYYVSGSAIDMVFSGNLPFNYQFTGNIVKSNVYGYTNGTIARTLNLSGTDGMKNITMNYSTSLQNGLLAQPIYQLTTTLFYLDTVAPVMSGTYPTANLKTNQTTINFQRNATEAGGISGYVLLLDGNVIYTGSTKNFSLDNISSGAHQWSVQGRDIAGNATSTSLINFIIDTASPIINGVANGAYYSGDVTPTFTDGTGMLNGQLFVSGTPITGDSNYTLVVTNDMGNASTVSFTVDKTSPVITPTRPLTGTVFASNNTVSFLRNGSDANISGYMFNLYGAYSTGIALIANIITLPNMPNNDYTRTVKAIDKAGNISTSTGQAFTVHITLTGSVSISGVVNINGQAFSNSTFGIQVLGNKDASLSIVGDLLSGAISDSLIASVRRDITITPTAGDGIKTFTVQATSGAETFSKNVTGYLDTTAPSTPTFSGQPTNYSGAFTLSWSASTDAGVGIGSYNYAIFSGSTIVKSGVNSGASIGINNMEIGGSGNYSLYVAAKDLLGNVSTSGNMTFGYVGVEDLTVDSFSITNMTNADLNVKYRSSIITVSGITTGSKVLASVDNGSLIVNGTDVGVNGYVKLGDQVQIALYSSQEYNDMTSGKLTIGDQYSIFKIVTTLGNGNSSSNNNYTISNLTTTEKLHVSMIYNTLSSLYSSSQQTDFMISLKALVKTKITTLINNNQNITDIETMEYLYNLINSDYADSLGNNNTSDSTYIAPNGKSYNIQYTSNGYTSSTFIVVKYFGSLTDIKSYIDQKNPKSVYVGGNYSIDQSRTTSTYIAPNGKSYVFFKTTDGKYGSNNFQTAKFFTSLADMKHHINVNNPAN